MRKNGMFMPGMGGIFLPPKKDDEEKKWEVLLDICLKAYIIFIFLMHVKLT